MPPDRDRPAPQLFADRERWREWLARHHDGEREVWVRLLKVHVPGPRLTYDEAVEEAICFGWVDGMMRSLDADSYAQRFTPRGPRSNWSASNLERFARMEAAGRMTDAGRARRPADAGAAAAKRRRKP